MTRPIDSATLAAIESGATNPAFLIEAAFEDTAGAPDTLRLWTGKGEIAWDGETWTGTGDLLTLDGIEEIMATVARGATFTLDGIGTNIVNGQGDDIIDLAYRTEYQRRPFTLWLAFIDEDARAVIGAAIQMMHGLMDVMDPQEDGETATITLTVENAMVRLEQPLGRNYTAEDQKQRYPDDTFFDQVKDLTGMEIRLD